MLLMRVSLICCLLGVEVVYSHFEGDSCVVEKSGALGTCTLLANCRVAINSVKRGIVPQTCGFKDYTPIVCCADEKEVAPHMPDIAKSPQAEHGQKSREKCKEYAANATIKYKPPTLIIGGTLVKRKELPHSAAIGYDKPDGSRVYHCGGSLISDKFVITAGHCEEIPEGGKAKSVRLGDLNLVTTTDDADPHEFDIAEIFRHPDYHPPSHYNDILLLRLAHIVKFNEYIHPLCLLTEDEPPSRTAIASGWGQTEHAGKPSVDLLKVTLELVKHDNCYKSYAPSKRRLSYGIVKESQICAGSPSGLNDTCQGDSGGPLQIYNYEINWYYLVGITSFGKVCGLTRVPAIYTRVSHYVNWIEKTVWP